MTLLVLCSALSVLTDARTSAAVPIALLAAYALFAERTAVVRRRPVVTGMGEGLAAGLAVALTAGAESPMLPYLLAPALAIGLAGRARDVGLVTGAAVLGLLSGAVAQPPPLLGEYVEACLQWVSLGLAFGLVAGWAQRLTAAAPGAPVDRYAQTRALLEELRRVTHRLPGGLDVASSAQALLDDAAALVPSARSAVLVQTSQDGALVPVAVRGTQRVPWRAPLSAPGPLQRAWDSAQPVVDRRRGDSQGRRHGSALLVMPLRSELQPFGLVILESYEEGAFPDEQVAQLQDGVDAGAIRLETGVLFDQVRSTVTVEERDRLAREMHDGVAQELAFVGYQLDALRGQANKLDDGLARELGDVRKGLTRLISDLRLSITDLKTSVGSDRGLGAALTSYVRAVGSGQKLAVHLSLDESPFRLPADQEVLLFQIAQAVAQDGRRALKAANLWVALEVDPPSARLVVEHDGDTDPAELDLSDLRRQMALFSGRLDVHHRDDSGLCVEAVLEGGERVHPGPAGR